MAFWQIYISDEFKNQRNFSYFSVPKLKIKTDLNTDAVPYVSPREYELSIDLDFMDYKVSPRPTLGASPQVSPQSSPRKLKKKSRFIKNK